MDASGTIFACINIGATEGNTSAPSNFKQFKCEKTGKREKGKLVVEEMLTSSVLSWRPQLKFLDFRSKRNFVI